MSKTTNIAWADSSANPVIGCTPCSDGCKNCYARADTPARVLRYRGVETWGVNAQRYAVKGFEKQMLAFNRKPWVLDQFAPGIGPAGTGVESLGGLPPDGFHLRRVFIGSNCDILDPAWPIATLAHTLDVLRRCPDIVKILCTKRPELWRPRLTAAMVSVNADRNNVPLVVWVKDWLDGNPPPNLWFLTSVENQDYVHRMDDLRKIPATVLGVSFEPLLGPITVLDWTGIGWAVIGGESDQPKHPARPCNVEWIRSLKYQAQTAGVPVFVKQFGSAPWQFNEELHQLDPLPLIHKAGADPAEWPEDLRVQQFPGGQTP